MLSGWDSLWSQPGVSGLRSRSNPHSPLPGPHKAWAVSSPSKAFAWTILLPIGRIRNGIWAPSAYKFLDKVTLCGFQVKSDKRLQSSFFPAFCSVWLCLWNSCYSVFGSKRLRKTELRSFSVFQALQDSQSSHSSLRNSSVWLWMFFFDKDKTPEN